MSDFSTGNRASANDAPRSPGSSTPLAPSPTTSPSPFGPPPTPRSGDADRDDKGDSSTDTPARGTDGPAGSTDTPARGTDGPAGSTDTPARGTDGPTSNDIVRPASPRPPAFSRDPEPPAFTRDPEPPKPATPPTPPAPTPPVTAAPGSGLPQSLLDGPDSIGPENTGEVRMLAEVKGSIEVANEVVEKVAALAALEVPGVADLGGDFERALESVRDRIGIGNKRGDQGVRAKILNGRDVSIGITIMISYGHVVMEVARAVKSNVALQAHRMLGLRVVEVNVKVDDVKMPYEEEEEKDDDVEVDDGLMSIEG